MIINSAVLKENFENVTSRLKKDLEEISKENPRTAIDKTIYQRSYLKDIEFAITLMTKILNENDTFLDLGSGVSPIAPLMAGFVRSVYAVDILKEDWNVKWWGEISERYNYSQLIISGEEKLPFGNETFDGICMYAVLEHIGRSEKEILEQIPGIVRLLKPGGYLFIFRTPQRFSYLEHLERKFNIPCHKVLLDTKKVRYYLERSGMEIIFYKKYGILPDFWPVKFLSDLQNNNADAYYKINEFLSSLPGLNFITHDMAYVCRKKW